MSDLEDGELRDTEESCSDSEKEDTSDVNEQIEDKSCSRENRCAMCKENLPKYRCPGCMVRTCCLECVKQHKVETGCTGHRDKTRYVSLPNFTDMHLLSDYRFLEEGSRRVDNTRRDKLRNVLKTHKPTHVQSLQKAARKRRINLQLMPFPMTKRTSNRTYFDFRKNHIDWQVEWSFPHAEAKYIDKVHENRTLWEALKKYVDPVESDPVIRQNLQKYTQVDASQLGVFMKVEGESPLRYYQLSLEKSIGDNLQHKVVIEYPTLHVVLPDHVEEYTVLSDCSRSSTEATLKDRCDSGKGQYIPTIHQSVLSTKQNEADVGEMVSSILNEIVEGSVVANNT